MDSDILRSDFLAKDAKVASAFYESIRIIVHLGCTDIVNQRFEDALEHFDSAIEQVNEKILAVIFVHRAHCFEELQAYDMMLTEAEQVIEYFPTSAHGYMQCARAMYCKGQTRDALLVYHAELQTVPSDDLLYQAMAASKETLVAEIDRHNLSQLKRLPYDVFSLIFSQLPVISRVRCSMTCKGWRDALLNWDGMWASLDFGYLSTSRVVACISQVDGRNIRSVCVRN